jgi:hypothetical protein
MMHSRQHLKEDGPSAPVETCVELPLLLSGGQLTALERAACHEGLTVGTLLRHLIRGYLDSALATPGRQCRSCSEATMATGNAGKILLIEGVPDTAANLRDILELVGYQVETAPCRSDGPGAPGGTKFSKP